MLILFLRMLTKNFFSFASLVIFIAVVLMGFLGPYITPHDPLKPNYEVMLSKPSLEYPLGTDMMGRDILSRILAGARLTLFAGIFAIIIATVLGVPLGLIAAYYGGTTETVIIGIAEVLLGLPYFLLVVILVAIMTPSLASNMIAIGIWLTPYTIRLIRGSALTIRKNQFIEAAIMSGENNFNIIVRYIFPNCFYMLIAWSTVYFAQAILMASALGFLGLGAQPPTPEWGAMTAEGRDYFLTNPNIIFSPAIFIFITTLSINTLGDTLRDFVDPKTRAKDFL